MTITVVSNIPDECTIILDEKFDFGCVDEFRHSYEKISSGALKKLIVDFRRTRFMDSSALGMLINMQRFWDGRCSEYHLINPNQQLQKIFAISRFDKKFAID